MIPVSNDIRIEVTTKCNYNCIICPHDRLERKKETMSTELFRRLLDNILEETDQYGAVTIPGMGEPFLDPELVAKVQYIKSKGLEALLLTNGSMLDADKFRDLEDAGADSIRVSFYGTTPETYGKAHGVDGEKFFRKVRDNLVEVCGIRKSCRILMTYNVIEGVNDMAAQDWIDFWSPLADLLEVWRPHNWAVGASFRNVQQRKRKTCGRPFSGPLQIQVDGTVVMCCFDYDGRLQIGDLKKDALSRIFDSEPFCKIRECHLSGDFEGSGLICESCDQRNADKSDVMVYSSKDDIEKRVEKTSTTYRDVGGDA